MMSAMIAAHAARRSTKPSDKPKNSGVYKEPYDPVKGAAAHEHRIERMQRAAQDEYLAKRKLATTKQEKDAAYDDYIEHLRSIY